MGILAPTDLRQWPSESEYMPLLRSLAGRVARVAINMALLTELFAAPAAPLRHVTDAYKERGPTPLSRRWRAAAAVWGEHAADAAEESHGVIARQRLKC